MPGMRAKPVAIVAVLVAAALLGGGAALVGDSSPSTERDTARVRVLRVVDGDTILVRMDGRRERVRYIGIDTPESVAPGQPVECYGPAAAKENRRLVGGRTVTLWTDRERRDRYGRLLAYVRRTADGLFVNAELVRDGFATTLRIPPNVAHARRFAALEREARRAHRGLWAACRG
jgi:micrococcal nuclease